MPSMFSTSTNMNSVKMNGKYFIPSVPTLSRTILAMNS